MIQILIPICQPWSPNLGGVIDAKESGGNSLISSPMLCFLNMIFDLLWLSGFIVMCLAQHPFNVCSQPLNSHTLAILYCMQGVNSV